MKDWSKHEKRARQELARTAWEIENKTTAPRKTKPGHKTISKTGPNEWKKRMDRVDRRNASKSGSVEIKHKCRRCGVIYQETSHSC